MKIKDLDNLKNKETCFIPYEQKTKNAYFVYLTISIVLFLSVFIFSLFTAINVSKYKLYNVKLTDFNYPILNLFYAPIVCLIAITVSMILLIFAPRVSIVSSKYSSRMFYTAFWLLILSVMLSSEVQLTYISQSGILYNENYHWINPIIARIFIIFSLFLILITQLFFWIMRRKFTFMNSDYEIYTTRSMEKKQRRIRKQELKKLKNKKRDLVKKLWILNKGGDRFMTIRNWWFISFYLLLSTFIIYELFFLIALSKNTALKDLYYYGFAISKPSPSFNPSSYTAIYYLPVIGLVVSSFGLISCIFTARVFLEKSPRFKFVFLVVNFIIFVIGFFISFSGQLLYCEWSNDSAQIISNRGGTIEVPSFYYRNWVSSTIVWSIFGFYFALLVAAVILLLKLNLINVQTYHFYRQRIEAAIDFEPELKQPLPSSSEFDPNDTQTITIFLDEEVNEKLQSKTNRKKIMKSSKNNNKKLNSKKKTNKVEKKVNKIKKS